MSLSAEIRHPVVVVLDSSIAVTGGFRCAQRMARLLAPWVHFVLVLPKNSTIPAHELQDFVAVERLPLVQLRKSVKAGLLYGPALLFSGARLLRLLRKHGATALIVNDFFQLQGWVARRLGWDGRILTWVRFDPWRFPGTLARAWLSAARQCSDTIVAVSDFILRRLPAGLQATRLYDCIDPALSPPEIPRRRRPDIVYVGNYIRGKGHDEALEAFIGVAHDHPAARLLFYGGDMGLPKNREFRTELQQRVAEARLEDRVLFHDFADDLPSIMADALLALNLSHSESFSLSCLEAQQLGLPVIAYRSGGPEEIIVEGETGLLVDVGDVEGAATAMSRLLGNPADAERMGQNAARSVAGRFAPAPFVQSMLRLLDVEA